MEATLKAADRCDRCGARATVKAELPSGGEVLLCAHHFSANGNDHKLRALGAKITDEHDIVLAETTKG